MNKHIELVKKWLDDPESVKKEELKDNATEVAYLGYAADAAAYLNLAACLTWLVKKHYNLPRGFNHVSFKL